MAIKNYRGDPVFRYQVADYLNIGTTEAPDFQVMSVFETIDENPSAQTTEKHYTGDKSATTITVGYKQQFPINADLYHNNKVLEFLRDIGEEQKLGVQTEYIRVRLYQTIPGKPNTFYARRFLVGFEISNFSGAGGEIMALDGNMNAMGDAVIGEFNTETRTFTPADEAEVIAVADTAKADDAIVQ